jgi:hypothetical protein
MSSLSKIKTDMEKDVLVLLHLILFKMKLVFEAAGLSNECFRAYDELGVLPSYVYKGKPEHRRAIQLLCDGILKVFKENPEEIRLKLKIK